jgi:hypothetical protein
MIRAATIDLILASQADNFFRGAAIHQAQLDRERQLQRAQPAKRKFQQHSIKPVFATRSTVVKKFVEQERLRGIQARAIADQEALVRAEEIRAAAKERA